jgi:hypothetical protein
MVTVWLASAATAVSPTPSSGSVYRQPYSSPDGAIESCGYHDGYMSEAATNELLRLRVSLADPQAFENRDSYPACPARIYS